MGDSEAPDDLDALLAGYEAQAQQDIEEVHRRTQIKGRASKQARSRVQAALETPISPDNKGFKMLAAMGYQPGQGLGQAASGPREPVPLTLKQDRLGLGRPSQRALKRARREEAGAAQPAMAPVQLPDSSSFLRQAAARVAAGRAAAQLRRAQQACENLDSAAGVGNRHGFWQTRAAAEGPDATAMVGSAPVLLEADVTPQLGEVLQYLRTQYWYCLYCGTAYENAADLASHCPGPSEADHADM